MVSVVTHEFFGMPMNEKRKLYSGDPKKTPRLSTSFNVKEEEVNNWRDYRRLNCYPIDKYVHKWPSNPFIDISSTYRPQLIQQTHSYYTRFDKASITMEALPNDLEERILLNLPPTELGTYSRVSMRCRNVIQSKEFIKEYIGRSTTEPRLLLVETTMKPEVLFHSMYQQANPLLSGKEKVRIPHSPGPQLHIDHPVRGLVCLSYETKVVITNPGAKEIVCLPENEAGKQGETKCFLGYDEDTDVYKVLCVPVPVLSTREEAREYQVLTVGSGGESWRGIECKHHHSLVTNGICKGGVVYFVALSECRQIVRVMSFNVNSEIFTVTELPKGAEIHESFSFVNYNGTMALVDELSGTRVEPNGTGVLEMWIMNELERTWETCGIELPCWEETVGSTKYFFKGTIGTGELVFAPIHWFHGHFSVLYYDSVTHKYRVFPIDGVGTDYMYKVRTFLDHVDSPLLI